MGLFGARHFYSMRRIRCTPESVITGFDTSPTPNENLYIALHHHNVRFKRRTAKHKHSERCTHTLRLRTVSAFCRVRNGPNRRRASAKSSH